MDEERRLGDYPFSGPVGYLELKYKRRVYKTLGLDEKQLRSLHTRTNLRRLLDYVANGQVEKITKMCSKGIDPNFHCQDTGGKFIRFRYINFLMIQLSLEEITHLVNFSFSGFYRFFSSRKISFLEILL